MKMSKVTQIAALIIVICFLHSYANAASVEWTQEQIYYRSSSYFPSGSIADQDISNTLGNDAVSWVYYSPYEFDDYTVTLDGTAGDNGARNLKAYAEAHNYYASWSGV